jgi:hypothetical protein
MAGVLSSLIVAARKDLVQRQADGIIADHRNGRAETHALSKGDFISDL